VGLFHDPTQKENTMSVIDRLKPGPRPITPLQAPEIEERIAAAEREFADVERTHGEAALDAVAGDEAAIARLNDVVAQMARTRDKITMLHAAHRAAIQRDEATVKAQRVALRKTQLASVKKHLDARDEAATALCKALEDAAKQFHLLLDRSEKAKEACPIDLEWPYDSFCEPMPIREAVVHELFRISASPGDQDSRALPGAQPTNFDYEWQPKAIAPMAPTIHKASAQTLAALKELEGR
jgi:hypothetical protein